MKNIDMDLFIDDELAACGAYAFQLYVGLIKLADRDGIVRCTPNKIKAKLLPYFNIDIQDLIYNLEQCGYILRFTYQGEYCLEITALSKHPSDALINVDTSVEH